MSFNMYATPIASGFSGLPANATDNWKANNSMSIYVHWVPDELNQQNATEFFSTIGSVSRVEFVRNKNETGRMLFVHFDNWHNESQSKHIRDNIGALHPEGYPMPIRFVTQEGKWKEYKLMCRINTRPIPVVEYNTHQLSDMFQRLNERVTDELETVRKENVRISSEFEAYRLEMDKNMTASKMMEQILSDEINGLKKMIVSMMEQPPSSLREIPAKPFLNRTSRSLSNDIVLDIQENLDSKFSTAV